MSESPRYSLTRIVGTGRDEFLLCTDLFLPRPAAVVLEGRKTVLIDRTDITPGSVLLQGRLRVVWTFQVAESSSPSTGSAVAVAAGPLWALTADIPFHSLMTVPATRTGMDCRVTEAHVTADASEAPGPDRIVDRSVVALAIEVTDKEERQERKAPPSVVQAPAPAPAPGPGSVIGRFGTAKGPRP